MVGFSFSWRSSGFFLAGAILALAASRAEGSAPAATPGPGWVSLLEKSRLEAEVRRERIKAAHNPTQSVASLERLARIYAGAGEYRKALSEYRYALILNPEKASAYHRRMADLYERIGLAEEALLQRELVQLTRDRSRSEAYRRRLKDWEKEGRYDLLNQEYRYLLRRDPNRSAYYLGKLALVSSRAGNPEAAREYRLRLADYHLGEIQARPEGEALSRRSLAEVYLALGEYDLALAQLARLDELDPEQAARTALARAGVLLKADRTAAAVRVLEELEKGLPPSESRLRSRIAALLVKASLVSEDLGPGAPKPAARAEMSAELRSLAPGAYRRLGNRLRAEGRYEEARDVYLAWSREFPGDLSPIYRLHRLYSGELNDPVKAAELLERFRTLRRESEPR